ncbi:hypothetical protein CEXT_808411 [Caerostris extrusa]|uniref:Uncharacterized protein n=1 Tax=Caerostris extrusa TaxID=172846 RepID=A0AAV4N859_CAEEX|nr:hypothetical protein CEXT_808411 [Caerostris extrusa]
MLLPKPLLSLNNEEKKLFLSLEQPFLGSREETSKRKGNVYMRRKLSVIRSSISFNSSIIVIGFEETPRSIKAPEMNDAIFPLGDRNQSSCYKSN